MQILSSAQIAWLREGKSVAKNLSLNTVGGATIPITWEHDIVEGSFYIDKNSVSRRELEIGNTDCTEISFDVYNEGKWDGINMVGGELILTYTIAGSTIPGGKFTVDAKPIDGVILHVRALDNMFKFMREYTPAVTYPATLGAILSDCCTQCGVVNATPIFPNSGLVIQREPEVLDVTFHQVVAWVAAMAGRNASINEYGELVLRWYDGAAFAIHENDYFELDFNEADNTITGIQFKDEDGIEHWEGVSGYMLTVTGNPFVNDNPGANLAAIWPQIQGFTWRPVSRFNTVEFPHLWPGDLLAIETGNQTINSIITGHQFGNGESVISAAGESGNAYTLAQKLATFTPEEQASFMQTLKLKRLDARYIQVGGETLEDALITIGDGQIRIEDQVGEVVERVDSWENAKFSEEYYVSTSATSLVGGSWQGPPAPSAGTGYIWTKTKITYGDGTVEYTDAICVSGPKGDKGNTGAQGAQGAKGDTGPQGVPGAKGTDGQALYTWIRYATSAAGANISNDPTGKTYIGLAHNKTTATESNTPADYTWSLIQGAKGDTGVAGPKGTDGQTTYTWIRYSDVADGSNNYDIPTANTQYIGIATNKTTATESTNKAEYTWSKFKGDTGAKGIQGLQGPQGIQGVKGDDGVSRWTHIRYSVNSNGNPIQETPQATTKYIGIAVTTSGTAPTGYASYTWALFKGQDGQQGIQGIQGPSGANGQPTYTWIKYADTPTTGMSDNPDGKKYIGIAHNKTTATESTTYADYTWSKIAGADGVSISSVVIQYAKHTSGLVVPPEGYVKTPEPLVNGSYLVTTLLWGIRFVADNDITIHSFDIYAETTGSVTLQLRNLGASPITTLFEKTVAILPGRNTVVFEQSIVAGTYWLGPVTTSVNLYRTSAGLAYPYNSGTFRILSRADSEGLNGNTTSGYYYIYNLLVSGEGVTPQAGSSIWADPPAPVWEKDKYIWQRTKITFSNGTIAYVGVQCIESDMATKIVAHHESDLTAHNLRFTEIEQEVNGLGEVVGAHATNIADLSANELLFSSYIQNGAANLLRNPTFGTSEFGEKTGWSTGHVMSLLAARFKGKTMAEMQTTLAGKTIQQLIDYDY